MIQPLTLKFFRPRFLRSFVLLCAILLGACGPRQESSVKVSSPDGQLTVNFFLKDGAPFYSVTRKNQPLVSDSRLGFLLKDAQGLDKDFTIASTDTSSFDETWTQPWGEVKQIRNNYHALLVNLEQATGRKLQVEFRAFNDGIGFRYIFPEQENLKDFIIMDELTEFAFTRDFNSWWIPAYGSEMDSEFLYNTSRLSEVNEKVCTPFTMASGDSLFVSIHEAALIDYAGMSLERSGNTVLRNDLYPWADGSKAKMSAPSRTPWRTIQVGEKAGDLITSYLVLNLNEPSKLADVSWIRPGKYTGIWWGMHLQRNTWERGPNHGATTANVKAMIDFASKHGFAGVLAEGWNEGWEGDWTAHGNFSFTKAYPDFDLAELSRYAKSKNVALISHHETGGNVANYENQLEDAFRMLAQHDIHYVKTGYVNRLPSGERHQSQFMVRHYQKVLETAARHKVMIDVHEPVKDTGLRRTWPNMMTREGVRGTEYEAWSVGNPPSHTTILPFTRGLAGPIDYTPGIFDIRFKNKGTFRVHTTLAKQLALYVVLYSPLHMAADLPENYEGNPALKFIKDVPTDWEETRVLNGSIGAYITTVRKDRNSNDWYLGSITNEQPRNITVKLDFLAEGKKYIAEIYQDGPGADMESNPLPTAILSKEVDSTTALALTLAPGGGTAIRFTEKD